MAAAERENVFWAIVNAILGLAEKTAATVSIYRGVTVAEIHVLFEVCTVFFAGKCWNPT